MEYTTSHNCIGCVMVSILASSVLDRGFEKKQRLVGWESG